jgi:hypothetical protein
MVEEKIKVKHTLYGAKKRREGAAGGDFHWNVGEWTWGKWSKQQSSKKGYWYIFDVLNKLGANRR